MRADERTRCIRQLNDEFRRTFIGGRVFITPGVYNLSEDMVTAAVERVKTYTDFTQYNDPHGEHDFGSFALGDEVIFWKIDYYRNAPEVASSDAAKSDETARVLTIMLWAEY